MTESSADYSSDDDLLASPVFKNRDRRTERADRTKLDFLDSCLRGSDARTDVHRRIASVEEEFKRAKQGGKDTEGENRGEGRESSRDGPGSAVKSVGSSDGKENVQNNAAADHLPISVVTSESPPSTSTKEGPSDNNRIAANDEEAYWSRVESFAATNAAHRTPSANGGDAVHSARRRLADAASGLAGYASDLTDDEGGKWRDGVRGLTREQMRSEAEAKSQGSSSGLGLREMFHGAVGDAADTKVGGENGAMLQKTERMAPKKKRKEGGNAFHRFHARNEAMKELKSIVALLQKTYHNPKTRADKVLRRRFVDPLVKIIKRPQDLMWDSLHYFLRNNPALLGRLNANVLLPEIFCKWVWRMACSSFEVCGHFSDQCCRLVRKFLAKELDSIDVGSEGDNNNGTPPPLKSGANLVFLEKFCMGDLVSCLEDDFGLWMGQGPMPCPERSAKDECTESSKQKDVRTVDVNSLKNFCLMWTALFNRNLVRIQEPNGEDNGRSGNKSFYGEDVSELMAALVRAGLDPRLHPAGDGSNTCGQPLTDVLQGLMASLVRTTARQILKVSNQAGVWQWIEKSARRMIEVCSGLGAGDEDGADGDDAEGCLPLAMAVKRMCFCAPNGNFSMEVALMKSRFAELALHELLYDVSNWDGKVKERMNFLCKDWDKGGKNVTAGGNSAMECLRHAMHTLVTAEVGFHHIDDQLESFMGNHPHFLATVLIAGECALIGTCMYWRARNDSEGDGHGKKRGIDQLASEESEEGLAMAMASASVYTTEQRDAVHESMSNVEDLCDGLKKECRAVIAYPHLRRTKEYLTRLMKGLGATKGRSSRAKRQKKREQGSLDSYFSRPSMPLDLFEKPYDR